LKRSRGRPLQASLLSSNQIPSLLELNLKIRHGEKTWEKGNRSVMGEEKRTKCDGVFRRKKNLISKNIHLPSK